MDADLAVQVARQALWTATIVSAPLLLLGFLAGVAVSLVQILTSMQDPAVNSVPRLAAFLAATVFLMPWMTERLVSYTVALFSNLAPYSR